MEWDDITDRGDLTHRGDNPECRTAVLSVIPKGTLGELAFRISPDMRPHRYIEHQPGQCDKWESGQSCMFCDSGLTGCMVCGGLEGALPTSCPGERMTYDQDQAVYRGHADYRDGEWVMGAPSIYSPVYWVGRSEAAP